MILADVRGIVFGPRTERFDDYDWLKSQPYNCFSIICDGRTLDIECKTREQFMTWFLGMQALCPLSHKFWNRGQLNWHRALYKTLQIAGNNGVDITTVWNDLVALSRKELDSKKEFERRRSTEMHSAGNVLHGALHGCEDSEGKAILREHLAKQALSILPSTPKHGRTSDAKMNDLEMESKGNNPLNGSGNDSDEENEEREDSIDMTIVSRNIDTSKFKKKKDVPKVEELALAGGEGVKLE